jgi:hypothetical protein
MKEKSQMDGNPGIHSEITKQLIKSQRSQIEVILLGTSKLNLKLTNFKTNLKKGN